MFDSSRPHHTGYFFVSEDRPILGDLSIKGPDTRLHLHDEKWFNAGANDDSYVFGTLLTKERISLHQCLCPRAGHAGSVRDEDSYYFADIFPHFVFVGAHHLHPTEQRIAEVIVSIDDAFELFYDFDSFGTSLGRVDDLVKKVIDRAHKRIDRDDPVEVLPEAEIAYWTGKGDILEAPTPFGSLLARNSVTMHFPGKRGVKFDREVMISLQFDAPVTFRECRALTVQLFHFLALLIGRKQTLNAMTVRWSAPPEWSTRFISPAVPT